MARGRTPEPAKPVEPPPEPTVKTTVARTVRIDFPNATGGTGYVEGRALGDGVKLEVYRYDRYSSFGGLNDVRVPDAQWDEFVGLLDRQRKLAEGD